ncbi:MAG: SOS response-associated peptidase [Bacteroidetes bacterium]|nr:SOS response-associated peptidase [Bacteroidota bacterium]
MCYDISFTVNIRAIQDYFPDLVFDEQIDLEFGPVDHVQGVGVFSKYPVLYRNREDGQLHCDRFEWGIIPFYEKEEPALLVRNKYVNIRAERILDDPKSYWYKIRNRRCLIPVTGIFEHRTIVGWKKKVPYLIKPAQDELFFLPGLYSIAEIVDKTTGELVKRKTFGLITRAANALMRQIHNDGENRYRMPLFVSLAKATEWLQEELTPDQYRNLLAAEIPASALDAYPVYTIRSPKGRPDGLWKTAPYHWEQLPALGVGDPA